MDRQIIEGLRRDVTQGIVPLDGQAVGAIGNTGNGKSSLVRARSGSGTNQGTIEQEFNAANLNPGIAGSDGGVDLKCAVGGKRHALGQSCRAEFEIRQNRSLGIEDELLGGDIAIRSAIDEGKGFDGRGGAERNGSGIGLGLVGRR